MKSRLLSEDVLRRVWSERSLREVLSGLYSFQQGLSGYPSVITGGADLLSLGLAVRKKGRLVLSPSGVSLAYHLIEYNNQVEQNGIKPVLEQLNIGGDSLVLDFGCGGGQTLLAAFCFNPKILIGFAEFLFRQKKIPRERYSFLNSEINAVALPERSFTHVICRLILYRVRVNQALAVLNRASKNGGRIYILAHSAGYYLSRARIILRNPVWLGYFLFVFINGLFFAATGLQLTLKLGSRRLSEIFFTENSLRRALRRNGFKVEIFQRQSPKTRRVMFEVFGLKFLTEEGLKR
ncbi:MAG: methyltransferase domain-containing protein [Candidatus Omnitrophica bacterium]|nr:methyltransferase domain-containing protein [Candidatus Omnitrophota bacterium]